MMQVRAVSRAALALFVVLLGLPGHAEDAAPPSGSVQGHALGEQRDRLPKRFADGADLPNGWRITPAGKLIASMGDLVTNITVSPDGKAVIAMNSGFVPHGLDVFDAATQKRVQHIGLTSTFLGLAWSADGHTLFVSGGNASGGKSRKDPVAPIYAIPYADGRLGSEAPRRYVETADPKNVWWSGVAYLPSRHWIYAANRANDGNPSNVVVFDADSGRIVTRIPVEISPYQLVLMPGGRRLFVSNWSSRSVSVIDTATNQVIRTLRVGINPNDMKLSSDGRLFVACSNDNSVWVIDTRTLQVIEHLSTTLTPLAPEGSTPDALALDDARHLLFIANADNNSVAVAHIENRSHSTIVGFIPTAWYPSALALADRGRTLYIGNAKGEEGHPDPRGAHSPLVARNTTYTDYAPPTQANPEPTGIFAAPEGNVYTLQTSSIRALPLKDLQKNLPGWTKQVVENTPYKDSLLAEARPPKEPSVIPASVGAPSPIKHIIYIIKENRTYDQVFGDLPGANGAPELTLFGEKVTPNQHALAKQYVILDNLYCDGEVSSDGHSWSLAAYATDFTEKQWPARYGAISLPFFYTHGRNPSAGFIWDQARAKGLTYRTYGEGGSLGEPSHGADMETLYGHVAKDWPSGFEMRDSDKVKIFLRDLKDYDANYDSPDPAKRLPNLTTMWMMWDHTEGTKVGAYTPAAMVADNDYAIGQLVEGLTHSRYWPETAIFIIEDDAQDGSDHVDARRTVGLVISPYVKRGIVDSTLYSTSSMLRSMELLLGLSPMSQYDAAAMPMYASFGTTPVVTPFTAIPPRIDTSAKNTKLAYGAAQSGRMDLSEPDRAPMRALNEIIWKSIRGADSEMPAPVHRFRPLMETVGGGDDDDGVEKNKKRHTVR